MARIKGRGPAFRRGRLRAPAPRDGGTDDGTGDGTGDGSDWGDPADGAELPSIARRREALEAIAEWREAHAEAVPEDGPDLSL